MKRKERKRKICTYQFHYKPQIDICQYDSVILCKLYYVNRLPFGFRFPSCGLLSILKIRKFRKMYPFHGNLLTFTKKYGTLHYGKILYDFVRSNFYRDTFSICAFFDANGKSLSKSYCKK